MAASTMFLYQKLNKSQPDPEEREEEEEEVNGLKPRSWLRLRRSNSYCGRRWWSRRKPRVRIPGLMRRFVGRKIRLVKETLREVVKRLKEGKSHLGNLFASNYMFMQVNPSSPIPIRYFEKSFMAGHGGGRCLAVPPPSRYQLPWFP